MYIYHQRNRASIELNKQLEYIAKEFRRHPTPAEKELWKYIRKKQLAGLKFRRQYPLYRYIVDFYCSELQLIIELDGPIHKYQLTRDHIRDQFLSQHGYTILRFTNDEVFLNVNSVLNHITTIQHSPSLQGKGLGEG